MKRILGYLFIATITPIASALAVDFPASNTIQPLSKYGQIQNVQGYSSNPFWTTNSPYNQKLPQVIYATGPELNSAECQSVVSQLVAATCSGRNNCIGVSLDDVKPTIMVQLSKMNSHNYVAACGGFIDPAFNDYVTMYSSSVQPSSFPNAVIPGNNPQQAEFEIENPYKLKAPKWYNDIVDRSVELDGLQAQNATEPTLKSTNMPKTAADLTYQERIDNAATGYEEWKCNPETGENCAYKVPDFLTQQEFCVKYPSDPSCLQNQNYNSYKPVDTKNGTIKVTLKGLVKR